MKQNWINKQLAGMLLGAGALLAVSGVASAQDEPRRPACIAPAQPGGGFDLTCRLAQEGLKAAGQLKEPLRIVYMPGGIGAVAYNHVVAPQPDDGSISDEHTSELQSLM